jgi:Ca-activated chloride channel family protein
MDNRKSARLETQNGQPVMLLGVKLTGELRGLLFDARVEQRFYNPTKRNFEVIYTFPLPWGAVLLSVDVLLGNKHLTGTVIEKQQAEASYEEALSEGDAAIMLEKNHDDSYSLNLGNLAPKEHCVITMRYAQTLQFEQQGLRLLIPSVIAPRYGNDVQDGGLMPYQAPTHSLLVEYPFDLEIKLHGELALARVASPSHPVAVAFGHSIEGRDLTVSLARKGALDRDFVLTLDKLAQTAMALSARDFAESDSVSVLASFCPVISASEPSKMAVKILVDCSGSMQGDSIDAARRALQAIIRQFGEGDYFSLSRFGNTVIHRSCALWKLTNATRLAAQRWVGDLEADLGGTEMEAALASTFNLAKAVASDVLIITDGEISAIDSTIESARRSGHRLFVVGIGSSPAESHLRRLAEAAGGACDFVAPGEAVEPAILRMFARLRSRKLAELSIVWPEDAKPKWVSPMQSAIFNGDTVSVYALFENPPQGIIRLLGKHGIDATAEEIGCAKVSEQMEDAGTLSRMVASARYQTTAGISEASALAVAYQLVTDKTNFLLIHEREENEKPVDMPDLHKVAQMVPAGWGGVGSVLYSMASPSSSPQADYLSIPAFCRKVSTVCDSSMDYSDIPTLLRKDRGAMGIDRTDPRYWRESDHYTGLTPLGVSKWLRITPLYDWPKSFNELRRIGLGAWVVDWLEFGFGSQDGELISESVILEAFLYLMYQRDVYEALAKSHGLVQVVKATVLHLQNLFKNNADEAILNVDFELVEKIMTELNGMTGDNWPDQVFAMTL